MRRIGLMALAMIIGALCIDGRAEAQSTEQDYLLHTQLPPALLRNLRIWDARTRAWRDMRPDEIPGQRAPVMVVHLWADYCQPCKEEFPLLRSLAEGLERAHRGQVQFVYLSETADAAAMERFIATYRDSLPRGPLYYDTATSIAQLLSAQRPSGKKSLPITVVLDRQGVIRQAVIGAVSSNRSTLATGIEKLVRLSQQMTRNPSQE